MKSNPQLSQLIKDLKKTAIENDVKIWKDIAERLEKPLRNLAEVNLSRISRYAKENETIIVPGKVLASGEINKKVTVAAFALSEQAKKKILSAKGKYITISELVKKNPKGSNIRIMG